MEPTCVNSSTLNTEPSQITRGNCHICLPGKKNAKSLFHFWSEWRQLSVSLADPPSNEQEREEEEERFSESERRTSPRTRFLIIWPGRTFQLSLIPSLFLLLFDSELWCQRAERAGLHRVDTDRAAQSTPRSLGVIYFECTRQRVMTVTLMPLNEHVCFPVEEAH